MSSEIKTISYAYFLLVKSKVYILLSNNDDLQFPLRGVQGTTPLDKISNLTGVEKNRLKSLINEVENNNLISSQVSLNGVDYNVIGIKIKSILSTVQIKYSQISTFPDDTCLLYFSESTNDQDIKNSLRDINFDLYDILRFLGTKNITILILVISLTSFFINEKVTRRIFNYLTNGTFELIYPSPETPVEDP